MSSVARGARKTSGNFGQIQEIWRSSEKHNDPNSITHLGLGHHWIFTFVFISQYSSIRPLKSNGTDYLISKQLTKLNFNTKLRFKRKSDRQSMRYDKNLSKNSKRPVWRKLNKLFDLRMVRSMNSLLRKLILDSKWTMHLNDISLFLFFPAKLRGPRNSIHSAVKSRIGMILMISLI